MFLRVLSVALLFVCCLEPASVTATQDSLRHVQIFFRHGQRAPTTYVTFPTEDPRIAADLPFVPGELTKEGILQEYNLGLHLRKEYGVFLGPRYNSREVAIDAGADNRTVASALAMLAGLFPPTHKDRFLPDLDWQPIPAKTEALIDAVSFGTLSNCPALRDQLTTRREFKEAMVPLRSFVVNLTQLTGIEIPDIWRLDKVLDAIETRKLMPDTLPPPVWARSPDFLKLAHDTLQALHRLLTDLQEETAGAWHFDLIMGRLEQRVRNSTRNKMTLYSGHDTNTLAIARLLDLDSVARRELQPFAHYLAVELHERDNGLYIVEFWLHRGPNTERQRVEIPECPSPCPYSTFRTLRPRLSTADYKLACHGMPASVEERCSMYATLVGGLVIIVVGLLAGLVATLCSCCHYRRKVMAYVIDESSPLWSR